MRHSDIRLTMNTYTHLQLIDTGSAVETLPRCSRVNARTDGIATPGARAPVWIAPR